MGNWTMAVTRLAWLTCASAQGLQCTTMKVRPQAATDFSQQDTVNQDHFAGDALASEELTRQCQGSDGLMRANAGLNAANKAACK